VTLIAGRYRQWSERFLPSTEAGDNIYFSGDSQTEGRAWTTNLCARLRGDPTAHNQAVSGTTIASRIGADPARIDANYSASATLNMLVFWCGTNDLSIGAGAGLVAADVIALYSQYCAARKAAGFRVLVGTMMPRGNALVPATYESERVYFNTLLRAGWSTFADGLIDVAADARLGTPGANTNATYFLDEAGAWTHLTADGYAIVEMMSVQTYIAAKRRILAR